MLDIKFDRVIRRRARQFLLESSPISNKWRIAIQNSLLLLRLPMMNPRREPACNFSKGGNDPLQRSKLFIVDLPRDIISYPSYRNVTICFFFQAEKYVTFVIIRIRISSEELWMLSKGLSH